VRVSNFEWQGYDRRGARMKELSLVQEYYSDLSLRKEIKKYKHRDPVFVTSAEIKGILNYLGYR
jgi:hypothetical protein